MNTPTNESGRARPLRILVIVSFPWDARLGAPQVWIELAAQWRAAGHTVEKYSLTDAFPGGVGSGPRFLINQLRFAYKARAFVRENAQRFDVIDAFIGALPFSKTRLHFGGLIVARSVGLHRYYDEFERGISRRWPHRVRGGWSGRIFYGLARQQLLRASERALQLADLINVPNADEAKSLGKEIEPAGRVMVQPYGLTSERRAALAAAAAPHDARLAAGQVCFVGMWSARKGAFDWADIIRLIRTQLPGTRFTFLGTMVDAPKVQADLGDECEGVEFISSYEPADLPGLLAAQTVGAFPSYAEGFGLAVLEQLASGIPTIAYAAAGPRDIVGVPLRELLVPIGDIPAFAAAIVRVLRMSVVDYATLAASCQLRAAEFSWPIIAGATVKLYRAALARSSTPSVMFVQPFALQTAGGGARILRALVERSPLPFTVICTSAHPPLAHDDPRQVHLPLRPFFGRIERTRLAALPERIAPLSRPGFRRRLLAECRARGALAVHSIPHAGLDFADSYSVARELDVPFFLQIHDDLLYSAQGRVRLSDAEAALREVWNGADLRFVISRQLGEEYCRRYGRPDFITITDGVETIAAAPARAPFTELHVYFMGLFHIGYEENLRVLLAALKRLRAQRPAFRITLTMRCGQLRPHLLDGADDVTVLPFGSEHDVRADLAAANLLYLPLPFGVQFERFTKLSLSTKLVTYLGSGIPILYHGPGDAAVCELLREKNAALLQTDLEVNAMATKLDGLIAEPGQGWAAAQSALNLASAEFMIDDQRRKFWDAIIPFCRSTPVPTQP